MENGGEGIRDTRGGDCFVDLVRYKSAHYLHVVLRDFWILSAVSFVLCLNLPSRRDFAIYSLLFLLFPGIRTFIPPRVFCCCPLGRLSTLERWLTQNLGSKMFSLRSWASYPVL